MKKYILIFFLTGSVAAGAATPGELFHQGNEAGRRKDYREAVRLYTASLQGIDSAKRYFVYNNRGLAYRHLKEPGKAMKDLMQALALKPGYAPGYNNIGILYMDRGDFKKALELFNQSLAYSRHYHLAYYNIACVYSLQKKRANAVRYLKKAARSLRVRRIPLQKLHQEMIGDPQLKNLKGYPPFEKFFQEVEKSLKMQQI